MKSRHGIPLWSILWLLAAPVQAAPPSADDFLPVRKPHESFH